jgi:lycopene cyclase CruA
MTVARNLQPTPERAPDLSEFRRRYPLTVANFGALGDREAWLRRIWAAGARWQVRADAANGAGTEAIVRAAPPANLTIAGEFDAIYAGGAAGLLHAAVAACLHGRRVLVFDAHAVGALGRDWHTSADELRELERAGLFSKEEIERAVVGRREAGFVKFHDAGSRVKAPPLWLRGVLDVTVAADKLLALAAEKIRTQGPAGCALLAGVRFVRAYVEPHRVTVETEDARGRKNLYAARLFVDATGPDSPVARQLNEGRAPTHVCPTVGATARGYARGDSTGAVDFKTGEILVSTEDASDHRQLIWEGFAGDPKRDEYTTYLFFYDVVDSPADKSLLALYERYFERLPAYKRAGAHWRIVRPVFGYVASVQPQGRKVRLRTADDRVLLVGGAAQPSLALGGASAHLRHLRRVTHLTELALAADLLDARALAEINPQGPRVAPAATLAEFLRPAPHSTPASVNETLNAVMAALHELDERVRRELFQDRLSVQALKSLLSRTAQLYPRIFQRVREHLGARGTFWWLAAVAEAAFSERRARKDTAGRAERETDEPPAEKFARHVARYRKEQGADDLN